MCHGWASATSPLIFLFQRGTDLAQKVLERATGRTREREREGGVRESDTTGWVNDALSLVHERYHLSRALLSALWYKRFNPGHCIQ